MEGCVYWPGSSHRVPVVRARMDGCVYWPGLSVRGGKCVCFMYPQAARK